MDITTSRGRDVAYQLHPFTNLGRHESEGPLVISRGKGVYVYDESGQEYLEALAGLWCTALGFGEPRLAEAAFRQLSRLPYYHQFGGKANDVAITLAERLVKLMPVPMSKVFFNNSGSEANESAVKLVWYYNNARGRHRKKKIIARQRAYHGTTMVAASLTGLAASHRDFDLPIPQVRHTDCPYFYRYGKPGESEEQFATRLAENLDAQIQREDPETVAAFIAEPVMGAGGVLVPPRTYFEKIQPVLGKYDVLLIADEVITGFGRTGSWFALGHWGVEPDIVSFAKGVTSGYLPLGGNILSKRVHDAILNAPLDRRYMHAATYSGHPVCCAVGLRNVQIIEDENLVERAAEQGRRLLAGLEELYNLPNVGEVRGLGLMCGVELVADKSTKAPALGLGVKVAREAMARGLLVRARPGSADPATGDVVCLSPPLSTPEETLDRIPQILRESIIAATR